VLAALLTFSGHLYQMYLLMAGLSAASCFFLPAQTAALPLIVGLRCKTPGNTCSLPACRAFSITFFGKPVQQEKSKNYRNKPDVKQIAKNEGITIL